MNFKTRHLILCFILLFHSYINWKVEASNILFFHLAASASHRNAIWPLAAKLADRGHNITYVIALPSEKRMGSHPKVEEISSQKLVQLAKENFDDFDINFKLNNTVTEQVLKFFGRFSVEFCITLYDSPEIQQWLNRPGLHYDLVMIDATMGECIYPLVYKFQAKHIIFAPVIYSSIIEAFGVIPETSSIPSMLSVFKGITKPSEMDFFGRLWTTVDSWMWRLGQVYHMSEMDKLLRNKLNFTDFPPLIEIERNASLVLINGHFIEDYPMALPPFFQHYSGLSCSKENLKLRKPLPSYLEKFVEENDTDGFIYISFGTVIDVSVMPVELRNTFYQAFEAFPKLKFLWRWTGEIPKNNPKNLLLQRWFPQQDVLAHGKIKAFVTQCGRPSSQEALCHGVPMITMPIAGDQDYNSNRLEYLGAAINLDFSNLTVDTLKHAFKEIVYSEKYKNRMSELSRMYKDRPLDPLDNAFFWTEYVLRHNTSIMKPLGMQQTWYERRLFDVYLVLVAVTLLFMGLLLLLVKLMLHWFAKNNSFDVKVKRE